MIRIALQYVDPLDLAFQRFVFSTLMISPILVILREHVPRDAKTLVKLVLLGVFVSSFELSRTIGLVHEKSGIGAVLTYTQPFFVYFMAVRFLGEKTSMGRLFGIIIGFLGVATLLAREYDSIGNPNLSILFFIAGALLWAVFAIYYKMHLSHINALLTNAFVRSIGVGFVGMVNVIIGAPFRFPLSMPYLFALMYSSIGALTIASAIYYYLLGEEEATVLSSSSLAVPMIAFIFGWLLLQETIELTSLLGSAFVILGIYMVNRG